MMSAFLLISYVILVLVSYKGSIYVLEKTDLL